MYVGRSVVLCRSVGIEPFVCYRQSFETGCASSSRTNGRMEQCPEEEEEDPPGPEEKSAEGNRPVGCRLRKLKKGEAETMGKRLPSNAAKVRIRIAGLRLPVRTCLLQ